MGEKTVITIAREYGSGGRSVGAKVAELLQLPFYDNKMIELAAEKSGLAESYVEEHEQKVKNRFLFNFAAGGYYMGAGIDLGRLSPTDKLFVATGEIIREIAAESCVIVGRCADYILRDDPDVINVFIYSDPQHKAERAEREYGIESKNVEAELAKFDKYRANHYNHYTGQVWGDRRNYHLCLNSGFLGIDRTAAIIVDAVRARMEGR